jgi:hypothetical protein
LIKDKEIAWRISPEIRGSKTLKYENESISISVIGARENYLSIQGYEVEQGRFFSARDDLARKRVAIIGSSVGTELKTASKALLGKDIDLGGVTFEIIGIMKRKVLLAGQILMSKFTSLSLLLPTEFLVDKELIQFVLRFRTHILLRRQ